MALIPGTLPTGTKYPNDPQALLDLFSSYMTAPSAKKVRPTVTVYPTVNGATISARSDGLDETVVFDHGSTASTATFTFPTDSNSVIGQTIRLFSRSQVTTLTVSASGLNIRGADLNNTTLAANASVAWQKVAGATWVRLY